MCIYIYVLLASNAGMQLTSKFIYIYIYVACFPAMLACS